MAVAWQRPILITTNPPVPLGQAMSLPLRAVVVVPQDRNIPSVFQLWLMERFSVNYIHFMCTYMCTYS